MEINPHGKFQTDILQELIVRVEKIEPEVLYERFQKHSAAKYTTLKMLIKRCKGHYNLMTSTEWVTLTPPEQAKISKYATEDMRILKELTYE